MSESTNTQFGHKQWTWIWIIGLGSFIVQVLYNHYFHPTSSNPIIFAYLLPIMVTFIYLTRGLDLRPIAKEDVVPSAAFISFCFNSICWMTVTHLPHQYSIGIVSLFVLCAWLISTVILCLLFNIGLHLKSSLQKIKS